MDRAELARLLDPDAWSATEEDQVTFGALCDFRARRAESERTADRILGAGYAVVRLPEPTLDDMGQPEWPVKTRCDDARLYLRDSDGRLGMDGVPNPIASPEHAESLAGALLAGATYWRESNGHA